MEPIYQSDEERLEYSRANIPLLPCIFCRAIPDHFPADIRYEVEHRLVTGVCPACSATSMPPDANDSELAYGIKLMRGYGVKPNPEFGKEGHGAETAKRSYYCVKCDAPITLETRNNHFAVCALTARPTKTG